MKLTTIVTIATLTLSSCASIGEIKINGTETLNTDRAIIATSALIIGGVIVYELATETPAKDKEIERPCRRFEPRGIGQPPVVTCGP